MATPAFTGDPNLARYLTDQYHYYHDQMGLPKAEAHSAAFADMLAAKEQGFVPVQETPEEQQPEILDAAYSDDGPL